MANLTVNNFNDFNSSVSFADELRRYKDPSNIRDSVDVTEAISQDKTTQDLVDSVSFADDLRKLQTPNKISESVNKALFLPEIFVTPQDFGGVVNAADNTQALQDAIDFCGESGIRTIYLSQGVWRATKLTKNFKGLTIVGAGSGRPGSSFEGGTRLSWIGLSGSFIENGSDDGLPWGDNLYNGPQGITLKNINLHDGSINRTSSLNCRPESYYTPNSYGIKDWRGGHIILDDVFIEGFEYTVWGINSDFNKINNLTQAYTKFGVYLGPRSDQSCFDGFYNFFCDSVCVFDTSSGHALENMQVVLCGSNTDHAVIIKKGSQNITFHQPWLENYNGIVDCLDFFDIGSEDGYNNNVTTVLGVHIENPVVGVQVEGSAGQNGICSVTNGERISISEVIGLRGTSRSSNLAYYFHIPSGVTSTGLDLIYNGATGLENKLIRNSGTGFPNLTYNGYGNQWTLGSSTGRLSIKNLDAEAGADELRISQSGTVGRFTVSIPNKPEGESRVLDLFRILHHRTSVPTSGTYQIGDYIFNQSPTLKGGSTSKYFIAGWTRITDGGDHVLGVDWIEDIRIVQNPLENGNRWVLSSTTGRLSLVNTEGEVGADELRISQEGLSGRVRFTCPNYTSGNPIRLDFRRTFDDEENLPTTGSYEKGDYIRNINPSVLGSLGSQYVIMGWLRLTDGGNHVLDTDWVECRALTGS